MLRLVVAVLLAASVLPANAAVVFMYHRFGEDEFPSTSVTLVQFEKQLDFLEREGFEIWPLPKLVTHLKQREPVPDNVVAITIDDAYASVYEHAFPMLRKRDVPFTVFVASDPVDQRLPDYMSWEELRELHAAGVTIANHGASHDYLVRRKQGESEEDWKRRVRADIVKGQARLHAELGQDVNESPRLFAWPFGEYDTLTMSLLEQMGYVAFGQQSGALGAHDNLRALPRFPVNERYGGLSDFALKANALPFPVIDVSPVNPVVEGGKAPVMTLVLGESSANLDLLSCYFAGERMQLRWIDRMARRVEVTVQGALTEGRSRYNCTAPHRSSSRWYWYSHLWIRNR